MLLTALAAACSREQQDWRSAEGADTTEGWTRFIEQHPASELIPEARAHITEIAEARDWQHASRVATVAAYREFLARHPNGRRSEDARIRIEAFSLGSAPRIDLTSPSVADARLRSGVSALQIATGAASEASTAPDATAASEASPASEPTANDSHGLATAGEVAQPAPADTEAPAAPAAMYAAVAAGYGVQLGAFGSEASADREWQRLQGRFSAQLNGLSPHIALTSTAAGQLYRLQVAAGGEAQARAICDSLREQSQACVPVLPQLR